MLSFFNKKQTNDKNTNTSSKENVKNKTNSISSSFSKLSSKMTPSFLSRKSEKFGDLHMISLWGSILARLSYNEDSSFIENYCKITDNKIYENILKGINKACLPGADLKKILNDESLFDLSTSNSFFSDYTYSYNGKKYIDFIKLEIPQNVNIINGEIKSSSIHTINDLYTPLNTCDVKYISICTSNYAEIYIVADKKSPNIIYLLFRGTKTGKSAASYTRPTSIVPFSTCKTNKNETFLKGIFKITVEIMHTIVESIRHLAETFLNASETNPVTIFVSGHSLGGAMSTIFSYLWKHVKTLAPYNSAPYNIISDKIICISLGSPRCLGAATAHNFCEKVKGGDIVFLRITTKGDPVPALPPKTGFQHPCSGAGDESGRESISEDCTSLLTARGKLSVKYHDNLDCINKKTRPYAPNMLSHMIYLDILYSTVIDFKKILLNEIKRRNGATVCRLIIGERNNGQTAFNVSFFDMNKARVQVETNDGLVVEDVKVCKMVFDKLIENAFEIMDKINLPLLPPQGEKYNDEVFESSNEVMPTFGCINSVTNSSNTIRGGSYKKKKRRNKSYIRKKTNKRRKRI